MIAIEISIIILTFNSEKKLPFLLDKLEVSNYSVNIIDSSSTDATIKIANNYPCNIHIIPKSDFNHGATRELARKLFNSKITVFFTDDAIPIGDNLIEELIRPIKSGEAQVSYARQIPRENADIIESFPRDYNYGIESQIRSIEDINKYGVHTFFCSNSCAAWSNKALDSIGGFKPTLTNEDYFSCAELLLKGYKVAYVSDAIITHSHHYSLKEEFQRMFDTGYVRAERPWIQVAVGHSDKKGVNYFFKLIGKLWMERPYLIPYAFIQTSVKYIGYKVGYNSLKLSKWFKKVCSGQKYYWDSKYYQG